MNVLFTGGPVPRPVPVLTPVRTRRSGAITALMLPETRRAIDGLVVLGVPPEQPLDFTEFFTECAPRMYRWIARQCGCDLTMAEDLVQEVFTQAWKNWERVGLYENPHAWVFRVARQMVSRYQRGLRRSTTVALPELPDHRARDIETWVDFILALPHLPVERRRAAFLVFVLEYTSAEAAEVLGLNGSTVRSHIHRARQQIALNRLVVLPDFRLPQGKKKED